MTKYRTAHARRGDALRRRAKRVLAAYPTDVRRGPRNGKVTPLTLMAEEMRAFVGTRDNSDFTWTSNETMRGSLASFVNGSTGRSIFLDALEEFLGHKEAELRVSGLPVAPEEPSEEDALGSAEDEAGGHGVTERGRELAGLPPCGHRHGDNGVMVDIEPESPLLNEFEAAKRIVDTLNGFDAYAVARIMDVVRIYSKAEV